jgi:hypothetical protein
VGAPGIMTGKGTASGQPPSRDGFQPGAAPPRAPPAPPPPRGERAQGRSRPGARTSTTNERAGGRHWAMSRTCGSGSSLPVTCAARRCPGWGGKLPGWGPSTWNVRAAAAAPTALRPTPRGAPRPARRQGGARRRGRALANTPTPSVSLNFVVRLTYSHVYSLRARRAGVWGTTPCGRPRRASGRGAARRRCEPRPPARTAPERQGACCPVRAVRAPRRRPAAPPERVSYGVALELEPLGARLHGRRAQDRRRARGRHARHLFPERGPGARSTERRGEAARARGPGVGASRRTRLAVATQSDPVKAS